MTTLNSRSTKPDHAAGPSPTLDSSLAVDAARSLLTVVPGDPLMRQASSAKAMTDTIRRTYVRKLAEAPDTDRMVRVIASRAKEAFEAGSTGGPAQHLRGHFVETIDQQAYNAKGALTGRKLVAHAAPNQPTHDFNRFFRVDGKVKFAGAVQDKASANGVRKAIDRMNSTKAGSATRGTVRVPSDELGKAVKQANGQVRVEAMDFTTEQVNKRFKQGLSDVSKHGIKAGSRVSALGKAGAIGAVVNVAIGGISEAGALERGDVTAREFTENRVVDAAEGGTSAVVGVLVADAAAVAAAGAITTSTGAAFAAAAGAAGTSAVTAIGGMGTAGALVAGALGTVTAPVAIPAIAGAAAVGATGLIVTQGFKYARRYVKRHRARRRDNNTTALWTGTITNRCAGRHPTDSVARPNRGPPGS